MKPYNHRQRPAFLIWVTEIRELALSATRPYLTAELVAGLVAGLVAMGLGVVVIVDNAQAHILGDVRGHALGLLGLGAYK